MMNRERVVCMESGRLELLCQIAKGIAAQFGSHCEVVVHDLTRHADHTIVAIENGHVSGRKVGGRCPPPLCWSAWSIRSGRPGTISAT